MHVLGAGKLVTPSRRGSSSVRNVEGEEGLKIRSECSVDWVMSIGFRGTSLESQLSVAKNTCGAVISKTVKAVGGSQRAA